MLAPLSWLKEYVDITLEPHVLAERLTEVGLNCEKMVEEKGDLILDIEVTPNRPDCLSILGIAREIAVIEQKPLKFPLLHTDIEHSKPVTVLPLDIQTDFAINPRFTGLIIKDVHVKESPDWLKERLLKIGQRPINNIVDITNYVMFELGNPLHAFDYDRIAGHTMHVMSTTGGERFESVDGISYHLPKHAVVISDREKILDLCGIKGGSNSGTFAETTTIFIRVPVEVPVLIRKTSQAMGLRSEASAIFERGVNRGGTIAGLRRCVDLILELAGGEIASELYDLKEESFTPWNVPLHMATLEKILGINISEKRVLSILEALHLSIAKKDDHGAYLVTIPTYRNDLQIEEDLVEEVARIYGYNNFPKTLPVGEIPVKEVPYFKDYRLDQKVKEFLKANGFSEIYTYSLISEKDLEDTHIDSTKTLRVDNPISREFEYLRPSLQPNLLKALRQNKAIRKEIHLYELGKVYLGRSLAHIEEVYYLSGISNSKNFLVLKGLLESLFLLLGISEDPSPFISFTEEGLFFEINFTALIKKSRMQHIFTPIPKYPPIVEDMSFVFTTEAKIGDIISRIKAQHPFIQQVSLLDQFQDTKTFHIIYLNWERNLTKEDIEPIRSLIVHTLSTEFNANLK